MAVKTHAWAVVVADQHIVRLVAHARPVIGLAGLQHGHGVLDALLHDAVGGMLVSWFGIAEECCVDDGLFGLAANLSHGRGDEGGEDDGDGRETHLGWRW